MMGVHQPLDSIGIGQSFGKCSKTATTIWTIHEPQGATTPG